jgi:hypothetical protein
VRRIVLLALVLLAVVSVGFVGPAGGVNWITTCAESHTNYDDPIVLPGQPGASHQHRYSGARTTNAFSTFESLVASMTTCLMPGDRSAYWEPSWYPLHPNKGTLAYYVVSSSTAVFPDGLKMIVGDSHATSEASNWGIAQGHIRFKCGPGSGTERPYPPASCSSGMLVSVVTFPQWWDGVRLDSPDHHSHMRYSRDAGHPVQLPRIKVYNRHAVPAGQPISTTLSSGPYYTYHMDFMDGWVKGGAQGLQHFIDACAATNCGTNPQ